MSWNEFIKAEKEQEYFKNLILFIQGNAKKFKVFPDHKDVFNALKYCPLSNTKVVIVGMDPYHGPNQAHGLAFSVLPGVQIPPSLKNIFQEIHDDLGLPIGQSGCLIPWAKQGVLLLNTVLTVNQGQPGSHKGFGWETFTDKIISEIDKNNNPLVFLLWGSFARSKKKLLTNPNHLVLETSHPSPLSVYQGFKGCKHFSKANEFLVAHNIQPIDWSLKEDDCD